jgi:hypothetical protein
VLRKSLKMIWFCYVNQAQKTINEQGELSFGENLASGKDKLIFKKGDQVLMEAEVEISAGTYSYRTC